MFYIVYRCLKQTYKCHLGKLFCKSFNVNKRCCHTLYIKYCYNSDNWVYSFYMYYHLCLYKNKHYNSLDICYFRDKNFLSLNLFCCFNKLYNYYNHFNIKYSHLLNMINSLLYLFHIYLHMFSIFQAPNISWSCIQYCTKVHK